MWREVYVRVQNGHDLGVTPYRVLPKSQILGQKLPSKERDDIESPYRLSQNRKVFTKNFGKRIWG